MARPRKTDPKCIHLKARFTESEAHAVKARADAADIHVSALVRASVLRQPLPPRTRRPPVQDREELVKLHGAVGRIGSNVNQLAYKANMGQWPEADALNEAADAILWMSHTLMRLVGEEPRSPTPPPPRAPALPFPKG